MMLCYWTCTYCRIRNTYQAHARQSFFRSTSLKYRNRNPITLIYKVCVNLLITTRSVPGMVSLI